MQSEPSSGINLTAYSCICWLFHRIYYVARNHKHKIVMLTFKFVYFQFFPPKNTGSELYSCCFNIWIDYSETKAVRILNAELADTLGNLLNRCSSTTVNPDQIFPKFCQHSFDIYCKSDEALRLMEFVSALPGKETRYLAIEFPVCSGPCVSELFFT